MEYAGGVGAAIVEGSKSGSVLKLSSLDVAVFVVLEVSSAKVLAEEKAGEVFVGSIGAGIVVGGAMAPVATSFAAFIKFSFADVQGSSGLANDSELV